MNSTCSAMVEASGFGSIASMQHKVLMTSKLEVVKEDEQELPGPASCDDPKDMNAMKVEKRLHANDKDESNKNGGAEDFDDDGNAGNKSEWYENSLVDMES